MMHCYPAENILALITYCLEPPCLVFQYMDNGTLNIKLKDHMHPLNWRQRSNISVGIARGLHHLHGNNIVHGDIKGQNILLDKHLEPKIGDFGTTKLLYNVSGKETTCLTNVANVSGTPYYLPNWFIEQTKEGRAVRKAIDVYSFGIILFEIMSGMLPSDKDTQGRTLRVFVNKHIVFHAEPPQEYIASVDRDNIWFNIPTTEGVLTSNWPTFLYDVVKACTTDQTEANPSPWRNMPTIEYIHQQLNSCFILYLQTLGEQPLEVITAGEKDEVAKTVRDGFARRMES
jgi:serine/threonine protein kinase